MWLVTSLTAEAVSLMDVAQRLVGAAGGDWEKATTTRKCWRRIPEEGLGTSKAVALSRSCYSHSMVPGGLLVMSSTTRLTSDTSLVMRVEMRSSTS